MNNIQELLRLKRETIARRKSLRTPVVPNDDRIVHWNRNGLRIIAEVKRASLSAGTLRKNLDVTQVAVSYEAAGATSISVLTEEQYFHGSMEDLQSVALRVSVPVLQKDFILDEYQIYEAKEAGAHFVLLIARFLTKEQLCLFLDICESIRVNAIVEVTDETDIEKIPRRVHFVGVNARNLETLEVDTTRFERLRRLLPDAFCIAESGIHDMDTLQRIKELGYHAALIGEHFVRSENPGEACKRAVLRAVEPNVKICGITNEGDAHMAIEAGASALGFIFAESSRAISADKLLQFRARIPERVRCIGVFRGNSVDQVQSIVRECGLDVVQAYDPMPVSFPVWNARTISSRDDLDKIQNAENLLLDLKMESDEAGESWEALGSRPVFALAGGLDATNVSRAIELCRPAWVDVARGVESEPGIKSQRKVNDFMKAVKK
jgi:indole-3-glycerol phosphate synthase/phosphoribosylanthranilate isomerase